MMLRGHFTKKQKNWIEDVGYCMRRWVGALTQSENTTRTRGIRGTPATSSSQGSSSSITRAEREANARIPKIRLLMRSAASAASGSVQQQDVEAEPPTRVSVDIDDGKRGALPSVMGPEHQKQNCRGNFSDRSSKHFSAVAITAQEGIYGCRENALRVVGV